MSGSLLISDAMNKLHYIPLTILIFVAGFLYAEDWTVLVYMAADNDLASFARQNLEQMEEPEQPQGLKLVVQVDLPEVGAKRYLIQQNPEPGISSPEIQTLGSIDSGDPDSLKDFILWGFDRYPAARKMLIIWSHANSWYKSPKYIAPDQETGNMIGVANKELSQALMGTPHLDILLFDACSMQSIEIMYELKDKADIIVGSADLVPVNGFPYIEMIPLFEGDPEILASQIPQLFTDSYLPGTANNPSMGYLITTCSAVKTSTLSDFYDAFTEFSRVLRPQAAHLALLREQLFEMNSGYADVDLRQFLQRLKQEQIIDTSQLLGMLDDMILASSYTLPWIESDLSSIALWYPDVRINLNNAWRIYMKLDFAKTGWLSLVNLALGADNTPPQAVELLSQDIRFGRVYLRLKAPLDVDSLYYRLQSDHAGFELYPAAYATEFELDFGIDKDGSYQIFAIDRAGNESEALSGTYLYQVPQAAILIRPNPVRDPRTAYLEWYHEAAKDQALTLTLYNLRGQCVLRQSIDVPNQTPGMLKLDQVSGFASLQRGIYFLELRSAELKLRRKLTILY
jgi:hypothetical protein